MSRNGKDVGMDDLVEQMTRRRDYHLKTAKQLQEAISALTGFVPREDKIAGRETAGKGRYSGLAARVMDMVRTEGSMTMTEILRSLPKDGKGINRRTLSAQLHRTYVRTGALMCRGRRTTRTYFLPAVEE